MVFHTSRKHIILLQYHHKIMCETPGYCCMSSISTFTGQNQW